CSSGGRFSVENCVLATAGIGVSVDDEAIDDVTIAVRGNSFAGRCISLTLWRKPNLPAGKETPPIRWDFSRNVVLSTPRLHDVGLFYLHQYHLQPPLSTAEAEALLPRLVRLEELGNVYQSGRRMLGLATNWKLHQATRGHDLADWNEFWNHESTGSVS